jgi:hypothetical protein
MPLATEEKLRRFGIPLEHRTERLFEGREVWLEVLPVIDSLAKYRLANLF